LKLFDAAATRYNAGMLRPAMTEHEVLVRAHALAGLTLGEVAAELRLPLPAAPERSKGFVGRLMERALGVCNTPAQITDFPSCELKTLPIDARGRPRESTFVCHALLPQLSETSWEQSRVRAKLARVLFLPIEADHEIARAERRVGRAFLWVMASAQEANLRDDYGRIADRVAAGRLEALDARLGDALQLRPKAAHAGVRVRAYGFDDAPVPVLPRAFYLRASFTACLLQDALAIEQPEREGRAVTGWPR
jgi:DNA mismatch repair protein MutH